MVGGTLVGGMLVGGTDVGCGCGVFVGNGRGVFVGAVVLVAMGRGVLVGRVVGVLLGRGVIVEVVDAVALERGVIVGRAVLEAVGLLFDSTASFDSSSSLDCNSSVDCSACIVNAARMACASSSLDASAVASATRLSVLSPPLAACNKSPVTFVKPPLKTNKLKVAPMQRKSSKTGTMSARDAFFLLGIGSDRTAGIASASGGKTLVMRESGARIASRERSSWVAGTGFRSLMKIFVVTAGACKIAVSKASTNSCAEAKRSSGFLAKARVKMGSSVIGKCWFTKLGEGAVSVRCLIARLSGSLAVKGK